jgi:hypothetical protein
MSHLRPEDIPTAHKRSSCKKGRHRYGEAQAVGGGIVRQVCLTCGAVTIDLTGATSASETGASDSEQPTAPLTNRDP